MLKHYRPGKPKKILPDLEEPGMMPGFFIDNQLLLSEIHMRSIIILLTVTLLGCKSNLDNFSREELMAEFVTKLKEKDTASGFEILNKYIEKFPEDASGKITLIQLEVMTGKLSASEGERQLNDIELYRKIIWERDFLKVYSVLDSIPPDSAIEKLTALTNKYPDQINNYKLIGEKLLEVKRYQEAIQMFDKVIATGPDRDYVRADKAFAQYMLGEKKLACQIWESMGDDGRSYYDKYCKN